jgi:hypothetical protein
MKTQKGTKSIILISFFFLTVAIEVGGWLTLRLGRFVFGTDPAHIVQETAKQLKAVIIRGWINIMDILCISLRILAFKLFIITENRPGISVTQGYGLII